MSDAVVETEEKKAEPAPASRHPALDAYGIPDEQVAEWKKQYGKIGCVRVAGAWYLYRPLLRMELRELSKIEGLTELDSHEKVVTRCLICPRLDEIALRTASTAGLATVLAGEVTALSDYEADMPATRL